MSALRLWLAPLFVSLFGLLTVPGLHAQNIIQQARLGADSAAACDYSSMPGVVYYGSQRYMTFEQLVSYVAPVYWFSPDEPLLGRTRGADIRMPEALPFEDKALDNPVVYYSSRRLSLVPGLWIRR